MVKHEKVQNKKVGPNYKWREGRKMMSKAQDFPLVLTQTENPLTYGKTSADKKWDTWKNCLILRPLILLTSIIKSI